MSNVAKDLAKLIAQSTEKKVGPYDTKAVVKRVEGNTVWVAIPGGVDETPISRTIDCSKGDTVQVRVSGGTAWITGNVTDPPTSNKKAEQALKKATKAAQSAERGLTSDTIYYLASDLDSGVTVDTPGWSEEPQEITEALPYLWIYHLYTYADGRTETTEPCIVGVYGPQGDPGQDGQDGQDGTDGTDGVSVTKVEPQYYLSTSSSSATGGSWSNSLPTYVSGRYYWTRDKITYSNGTTGYSTATYSPGLTESVQLSYNTAQHFWTRNVTSPGSIPNGAYVTEQTESSYLSNPTGGATLIRSDKVDILVGNKPYSRFDGNGTHIYEGTGTPASPGRELATFSGAGVRFQNENDVKIFDVGYTASQTASGHIDVFPYDNSTTFVIQLPWGMTSSSITLQFFTDYPTGEVTGITTTGHYTVNTSTSKVTLDSTLCSSLRSNSVKFISVKYNARGSFPYYILGTSSADPTTLGEFSAMIGENNRTVAAAGASLCLGESNLARGTNSIAAGLYSEARGMNCMALGKGVVAGWGAGTYSAQLAIGEYNTRSDHPTGLAFVIGNGTDDATRSDALTVNYNGAIKAGGLPSGLLAEEVSIVDNLSVTTTTPTADGTKSVAKTGYTPIGIVGFRCVNASSSGTNGAYGVISHAYLSGTNNATANYRVRNVGTATMKVRIYFTILYALS